MNNKCPHHYANSKVVDTESPESERLLIQNVRDQFKGLMNGKSIDTNSPEGEQAYFAFQIAQFGNNLGNINSQLLFYLNDFSNGESTYEDIVDELGLLLKRIGGNFWRSNNIPEVIIGRLVAGLDTFHSFMKRAVLFPDIDKNGIRTFPYQKAIQLASTHIERANYMANNPDILAWNNIFFDPTVDTSKQFLGYQISNRPLYRCPVLYSGKFRELTEMYFAILCQAWEISRDKPKEINWNNHDL